SWLRLARPDAGLRALGSVSGGHVHTDGKRSTHRCSRRTRARVGRSAAAGRGRRRARRAHLRSRTLRDARVLRKSRGDGDGAARRGSGVAAPVRRAAAARSGHRASCRPRSGALAPGEDPSLMHDVVIAGGGPAGLAAAIRSARRGFRTLVLERSEGTPDKACGEGLMPRGAGELERLGVRVAEDRSAPFRGIRYLQEDGTILEARFRGRPGVGIRRTALVEALREAAVSAGVEVRRGSVVSARARGDVIDVETDAGRIEARLVIAADGLHSPLRRAAGLEGAGGSGSMRFGVRRHFALAPWTDLVEVHWAPGIEAYVTPVGPRTVNVALLRDRDAPG